jgi:hypothetical protein
MLVYQVILSILYLEATTESALQRSKAVYACLRSHPEPNIPTSKCPKVQYAIENMSLIISVIRDS